MASATPSPFPAIHRQYHHPLDGSKLYCLVTEAHVCEQLAQSHFMKVERGQELNPRPADCKSNAITTTLYGATISHLNKSSYLVKMLPS